METEYVPNTEFGKETHLLFVPNGEYIRQVKNEYDTLRKLENFPSDEEIAKWKADNIKRPQTHCRKPKGSLLVTSDITKVTCPHCRKAYESQKKLAEKYGVAKGNY